MTIYDPKTALQAPFADFEDDEVYNIFGVGEKLGRIPQYDDAMKSKWRKTKKI